MQTFCFTPTSSLKSIEGTTLLDVLSDLKTKEAFRSDQTIGKKLHVDNVCALSDRRQTRKTIDPTYKSNRRGSRKPWLCSNERLGPTTATQS